jgi:anti-sigma factor RsiW
MADKPIGSTPPPSRTERGRAESVYHHRSGHVNERPTASSGDDCPDVETLAAYVDGLLDPATRAQVEEHAADCSDCREILADAAAFVLDSQATPAPVHDVVVPAPRVLPFPRPWRGGIVALLAVAAAALIVVRINPGWLPWSGSRSPDLAALIATLGNQPTRPIDGRLSGGFSYRPQPTVTRGSSGREISPEVQIAAANIELAAPGQSSSQQAARGLALLATGEIDRAIGELENAVRQSPGAAAYLNDLSAAYLARAATADRAGDWTLALQTADRALALEPAMKEALFNRALALGGSRSTDQARAAWQAYLKIDPTSPWGLEAASRCGC